MKVELYIPLDPVPWAVPRLSKNRCYDPREKDKRAVRYLIAEQYQDPPIEDYVAVQFIFEFPMPKSATKKQRADMLARKIFPTKCDCTNLQKLYEDCLKKIVITDDRNVVITTAAKFYAEVGAVSMIVQESEEFFEEHLKGIEDAIENRKKQKSNK